MKKTKIYLLFTLILVLTSALIGCSSDLGNKPTSAENDNVKEKESTNAKEFRLGHVFAAESVTDRASKKFAELVNEKTNGEIRINVFPAGQIGGDEALGQDISRGTLELAFINQGSLAGLDPLLDFHYMPYIVTSNEQADQLYYGDGIIPTTMKETLAKHGMRTLGFYELEFRGLTNGKKQVKKLSDLNGLKLRVPGSRAIKDFFEEAGVQAVAIPMPELYTSLQQGVVDGQDNGLTITFDNKLHEPNPYITQTNHVYASGSIVISEKTWGQLTQEQQKAFEEAGKEIQDWQITENRKNIKTYKDKLKDEGIEVVELSEKELKEFTETGRGIWDSLADIYGAERISKLREEIENLQ
ncbi:TRAP transporter substrate-binding protein [Bacillus canaveralius]|uniref:TRAP transporter substrate-binding protein n=1 Tax=Bacillus canaveralius TaxID=1403243 RepID=UPI000F78B0A1|nr:TRAP transporter substrate-binding protein [Bacillus canaveralius]RSK55155.1 TRAP transporter substrate-binding protein [Bacillus canaveralius]